MYDKESSWICVPVKGGTPSGSSPLVSVLLVNWNGKAIIGKCLQSILAQSYSNMETIVIDCASQDGSVDFIRTEYPNVRVLALKEDRGLAFAYNYGVENSKGQLIMIMNNDVVLPHRTVEKLVSSMNSEDKVLAPIELTEDGRIRGVGWTLWLGDVLFRTIMRPEASGPFYPACACLMASRTLLETRKFNENFFMFADAEWGWRLQLCEEKLEPAWGATYYHKGSATKQMCSKRQLFLYGRARIATNFVCLGYSSFAILLLPILLQYVYDFVHCARYHKLQNAFQSLLGLIDFFRDFDAFRMDRREVQRIRRRNDRYMVLKMVSAAHLNALLKNRQLA